MSKNVQATPRDQSQNGQQEQILKVENLRKTFGGITAVADVSFHVEKGTITGLIGPNGAGKSTTFDLITGVQRPDGGAVEFNNTEITGYRSDQVANQGLVRTFQIARELSEMTVLENLMLAPQDQAGEAVWRAVLPRARTQVIEQEKALREQAWEMLELFEIEHVAHESAGNLSGGQRKLLEMARVLMTEPEMVLLDEPLAGVNPTLEEKLIDRLHTLKEQGYTFLFVEHDMDVIMNNCDTVIVMHQGSVLTEGHPDAVKNNDKVLDAYLGEEVKA
ncbi:ABC transporter ATP-binding protein [Haloarcula rubripromontorii]|uniref:Probable branched-chain amino acid transport ATP-binding protein LivG n=1 Tax=Haloarcula rubripromontorii TaxID=1705562 RepID=A0A847TPB6_9EURY|nr:ABC transporter ATP-binding protein [Haloarcula rubripromontorii]NLV07852.1 ATP-binding cassette domain-containing protein [Haloarcula rubripromontorii]